MNQQEQQFLNKKSQNEEMEDIFSSIMTAEEYRKTKWTHPHVFELKNGNKEIHYFGSPHSYDGSSPIFGQIEEAFKKANPDIVFVEGINKKNDMNAFNEKVKRATKEKAIEVSGESGFAVKLAVDAGVEWYCPEPKDEDMYNVLLNKGFSKDEIFAWEIFGVLPQYHRQMTKNGFKEYADSFIQRFKSATAWENFDYSYENALRKCEEITKRSIDVEDEKSNQNIANPILSKEREGYSMLNAIALESTIYRDRNIVSEIAETLKTHNKLFVVYGSSHAIMQEPALKKLMEHNKENLNTQNKIPNDKKEKIAYYEGALKSAREKRTYWEGELQKIANMNPDELDEKIVTEYGKGTNRDFQEKFIENIREEIRKIDINISLYETTLKLEEIGAKIKQMDSGKEE